MQFLRKIKQIIRNLQKLVYRKSNPVQWHNMRSLQPISKVFGFDRGTPILL